MDIVKVFGSNVKRYRQQTGLSQEAFAEKCGMHRTYISAIECFRRSISLENIQRIADALGVEPYKLFLATVYKGNIIKNLIMDCQSYTKYRPNETTGGIFVSWRRKEELPTGA